MDALTLSSRVMLICGRMTNYAPQWGSMVWRFGV
jgi:hypothetical protein